LPRPSTSQNSKIEAPSKAVPRCPVRIGGASEWLNVTDIGRRTQPKIITSTETRGRFWPDSRPAASRLGVDRSRARPTNWSSKTRPTASGKSPRQCLWGATSESIVLRPAEVVPIACEERLRSTPTKRIFPGARPILVSRISDGLIEAGGCPDRRGLRRSSVVLVNQATQEIPTCDRVVDGDWRDVILPSGATRSRPRWGRSRL
jgi:hypothetical protein